MATNGVQFKKELIKYLSSAAFNSRSDNAVLSMLREDDEISKAIKRASRSNLERACKFLGVLDLNIGVHKRSKDLNLRRFNSKLGELTDQLMALLETKEGRLASEYDSPELNKIFQIKFNFRKELYLILYELSRINKEYSALFKNKKQPSSIQTNKSKARFLEFVMKHTELSFGKASPAIVTAISNSEYITEIFGSDYSDPQWAKRQFKKRYTRKISSSK